MNQISIEEQKSITTVIIKAAVMLLEHGAESRLIEQISLRFGKALGCDSVEMSLIPSAVVLTTLVSENSHTTTRRAHRQPINMSVVHEILQICISCEHHHDNVQIVRDKLHAIRRNYYNKWLLIVTIGLSCAAFSHLHGSDWVGFGITFLAASIGMGVRILLSSKDFAPSIVFALSAFVITLVASLSSYHDISATSNIVLSSSVLLLVPGFPYINAILDVFKGYLSMAWGRWMQATVLTFMTSIGMILAMSLLKIQGW
ncbi:threonine/serine ThrE exporter family protein [Sulfurospirillum sp. 1612]|uniref:threonine/serine ThrE exporter family protein n=1 Tax=Sulfurospirillum sp. 1612 TaxID=3094835 RepID=UPI002F94A2EF